MGCLQFQEQRFYELGYALARWTGQMHIQPYVNYKLDNFFVFLQRFSEPGYGLANEQVKCSYNHTSIIN